MRSGIVGTREGSRGVGGVSKDQGVSRVPREVLGVKGTRGCQGRD